MCMRDSWAILCVAATLAAWAWRDSRTVHAEEKPMAAADARGDRTVRASAVQAGQQICGRSICEDEADDLELHIVTWLR